MVGDGANDCGALKAAHAGISLSDAESSVASPFTSREPSVSCVQRVMREGRAALVTSFGLFKYMAAYSLTQFTSVLLLYERDANLSDIQFLYIDLFLITTVAFFFGRTESHPGPLAKKPPSASLFSPAPIASLIFQLLLVILTQFIALAHIQSYPWFTPFVPPLKEGGSIASYENYAVFSVSAFQYLVLAAVFSQGAPYRQPLRSNIGLMVVLVLGFSFSIFLVLYPPDWLEKFFEFRLPPEWKPRFVMLAIAAVYSVVSWCLELTILSVLSNFREGKHRYEQVEKQLTSDSSWPPLSDQPLQVSTPESPETRNTCMKVVFHTPQATPNHMGSISQGGEVTLDPAMLMAHIQRTPKKDNQAC
jgi:cation-transporting ATPase 13A3/4/5